MSAALDAGEHLAHRAPEAAHQIEADKAPVGGADRIAHPRIGHAVRAGHGVDDVVVGVDGQPHTQQMDRLAGRAQAGGERVVTVLDVGQRGLELAQAILAQEAFDLDAANMHPLAGNRGR